MPATDDPSLVEASLRGDGSAFAALFERHRGAVASAASAWAYHHEIDDVVQETFARALEGLHGLAEPARLRPWLVGIARHVCADLGRRKPRERCRDHAAMDRPDHERGYDRVEAAVLVAPALARVPRRDAAALWARDAEGFPVAAIARATGRTVGAERVQATRTRRALAAAIGKVAAVLAAFRLRTSQTAQPLMAGVAAAMVAPPLVVLLALPLTPPSEASFGSVGVQVPTDRPPGVTARGRVPAVTYPEGASGEADPGPAPTKALVPGFAGTDRRAPDRGSAQASVAVCDPTTGSVIMEYRYDGYGLGVGNVDNCAGPSPSAGPAPPKVVSVPPREL